MNLMNSHQKLFAQSNFVKDAYDYLLDSGQRSVLFMDTLRKRGNIYYEQIRNGKPPVLTFGYDIILDGRTLERPVAFSLARIHDRRDSVQQASPAEKEKRHNPEGGGVPDPKKRPVIIIDPRAGHGPGIGGSKRDSEIGMALNEGHPVYFVIFEADPLPDQTLTDVHHAQIRFIEEVIRRHPEAQKPAIIGNCQAGWASALVGADRPDIAGPLVFNGSPLSYWAGVDGKNPMRYRGGLTGGVWLTSLMSDLGNGIFDGANLVAGFEDLNPANTWWNKQYYVYANVDKEADRYLEFERWWNAYFMLTREEIHYITQNLFVGNKLEMGELELEGRKIDLKNLKDPVLIFASSGDNITPPQQALNWIAKVWKSVAEIKRHQQVVVYLLHDTIGHLGIFVSGKVSKKEHKEIIASIDLIGYLSPGLYEMVIEDGATPGEYQVRFEEREMQEILTLDDGASDEEEFRPVAAISEINDRLYRTFISPWVRSAMNDWSAEWIRQLHPLRVSRYAFSDRNPWMLPYKYMAPLVKANRRQAPPGNPFVKVERGVAQMLSDGLNLYRDMRDQAQELWFKAVYGNPWMLVLFRDYKSLLSEGDRDENACPAQWLEAGNVGGFAEGVVRIMVAMAHADEGLRRTVLKTYDQVVAADERLRHIREEDFRQMIRQQACILDADEDKALGALAKLIPEAGDRIAALEIARKVALADHQMNDEENLILEHLKRVLKV
ncbi:MAG: DUF3141 domain-containing protein [Thermodesulfobacteriota bacterium]